MSSRLGGPYRILGSLDKDAGGVLCFTLLVSVSQLTVTEPGVILESMLPFMASCQSVRKS